jgi:outer membrane protein assembly factor BamA
VLRRSYYIVLFCIGIIFLTSCGGAKLAGKNQYLLNKNKIEGVQYSVGTSDIKDQIIHEPNRKVFFFKFHLWLYQLGLKKLGEEPVFVDSTRINKSVANINSFLFSKGYFDNEVAFEVVKKRFGKKANVIYKITENQAFKIDTIDFEAENPLLHRFMEDIWDKNRIESGDVLDYQDFEKERKRISTEFRNSGFYRFNRSMIDFQLDTNQNQKVNVRVRIQDRGVAQKVFFVHKVNVTIYTDEVILDSTLHKKVTFHFNGYKLKPDVLHKNIVIAAGEKYNQKKLETTYSRLFGLDMFSFIDISFKTIDSSNLLECNIALKPSPTHDWIWEPQLVTTEQRIGSQNLSRNFGFANALSLKNKNIFRNGEEFLVTLRTGWEAQIGGAAQNINTFSQEVITELKVPQLMFINEYGRKINSTRANTRLGLSYIYEKNRFYTRKVLPFSFTWEGKKDKAMWYITPVTISYNQSQVEQDFLDGLPEATQSYFKRIFTNNLITSFTTVLIYSDKDTRKKQKSYWYIRSTLLEAAGVGLPSVTDGGQIFGVNHASFLRSDADVRFNLKLSDYQDLVLRSNVGLGMPLYRSFLPYERRYFVGGANNLRGFRPRTIGPGSYSNTGVQLDRSGEIMMQGNVEYRNQILNGVVDLEGAIFLDVGNVWNVVDDANYEGGLFQLDKFPNEFALNTGLGLRFDLDFFLIRLDWGVPVKDPNEKAGERLVIKNFLDKGWIKNEPVWNIAIGYPF